MELQYESCRYCVCGHLKCSPVLWNLCHLRCSCKTVCCEYGTSLSPGSCNADYVTHKRALFCQLICIFSTSVATVEILMMWQKFLRPSLEMWKEQCQNLFGFRSILELIFVKIFLMLLQLSCVFQCSNSSASFALALSHEDKPKHNAENYYRQSTAYTAVPQCSICFSSRDSTVFTIATGCRQDHTNFPSSSPALWFFLFPFLGNT